MEFTLRKNIWEIFSKIYSKNNKICPKNSHWVILKHVYSSGLCWHTLILITAIIFMPHPFFLELPWFVSLFVRVHKSIGITTFVSNEVSWKKFPRIATISWPVEIILSRIYQNRGFLLLKSWVLLDSIFSLIQQEVQNPLIVFVICCCKQPLHMNSPNAMLGFVGGRGIWAAK